MAAVYSATIIVVGFDMMYYEFGSIILAILEMLQGNLQKAIESKDLDAIKRVVDHHSELNEYFLKFKEIFAPVIFNRFLVSSITLCVLGFQIIVLKDQVKRINMIAYLLVILMKLMTYAYIGSQISNKVRFGFHKITINFINKNLELGIQRISF
jgi:hypothetical protein